MNAAPVGETGVGLARVCIGLAWEGLTGVRVAPSARHMTGRLPMMHRVVAFVGLPGPAQLVDGCPRDQVMV